MSWKENSGQVTDRAKKEKPSSMNFREAFHGPIGELSNELCENSEADPIGVLLYLLTAIGNMAGRDAAILVDSKYHYPNIYATLVGKSSVGRKGTAWSIAKSVLRTVNPKWVDKNVHNGFASAEALIMTLKELSETERYGASEEERTIEVNGGSVFLNEEELGKLLVTAKRNGSIISSTLRGIWDGDFSYATKDRVLKLKDVHVSIIGHITAHELNKLLDSTEMTNGFANRFLWIHVHRHQLISDPFSGNNKNYTPSLHKLIEIVSAIREMDAEIFTTSANARRYFAKIYAQISEPPEGILGELEARGAAIIIRLALIFAICDRTKVITDNHFKAAKAIWDYNVASIQYIFSSPNNNDQTAFILQAIRNAGPSGLARTDLHKMFNGHLKRDALNRCLEQLHSQKLILKDKMEGTGGRSKEVLKSA